MQKPITESNRIMDSSAPMAPPAQTGPTVPVPTPVGHSYPQAFVPNDSPPKKKSRKHWIGYPVTAIVALAIGAAGGGGEAPAAAPTAAAPPVAVTQTVTVPQPVQTVTETVRETVKAPAPKAAPTPAAKVAVPDGTGLNYQQAQDLWRGAGLTVGLAVDATGANRLPVLDSGWVVLSQDLAPGTKVAADSIITATVKKYTDD